VTPVWPIPFENSTELTEYYWMQALPKEMALLIGRLDATNFLDKNSFTNNPETQFLNASLNNALLLGEFLSFSTYAALLLQPINKNLTISYAVWDPETKPGDYGGVWDHYGVAVNVLFDYQTSSGKKGSISPTVIYTNKDALQGNPAFVPGVPPIIECCLPPTSSTLMQDWLAPITPGYWERGCLCSFRKA
jgi:hypothetical protein